MEQDKLIEFYSGKETDVFWNMDDRPIPVGIDDLGSISRDIEKALARMGFRGHTEFNVHCQQLNCDTEQKLLNAQFFYLPSCTETCIDAAAAVDKVTTLDMTAFMILYATTNAEVINLAVIGKAEGELLRVMQCLESRGHNVLLIDITGYTSAQGVDYLLANARLLGGEIPRYIPPEPDVEEEEEKYEGPDAFDAYFSKVLAQQGQEDVSEDACEGSVSKSQEDLSEGQEEGKEEDEYLSQGEEDEYLSQGEEDVSEGQEYVSEGEEDVSEGQEYVSEGEEDVSEIVDFSKPISPVKGIITVVFWDAADCPFPLGFSAENIYDSITSALVKMGSTDNITIWAYLGDNKQECKFLGVEKTWASRIYFLPGGNKASRRVRMLNDILLMLKDSPELNMPNEASLVLVADQFKDDPYYMEMLEDVETMNYNVVLVTPTKDINKPESPEWPELLISGGLWCPYHDEIAEPCPQKH